ncbi:MAG: phage integrase SAM-like domain-containing protein [Saprospiraceae bacterium]|nr:phage integrase SAM-like domain-containing protein [Saprospiraceae bacterium]
MLTRQIELKVFWKYSGCLLQKLNNSLVRNTIEQLYINLILLSLHSLPFCYIIIRKMIFFLDKVRLKHLLEYEEYAAMVLKHKTATINKTIQRLKQIIKYAIGHDYLDKDP